MSDNQFMLLQFPGGEWTVDVIAAGGVTEKQKLKADHAIQGIVLSLLERTDGKLEAVRTMVAMDLTAYQHIENYWRQSKPIVDMAIVAMNNAKKAPGTPAAPSNPIREPRKRHKKKK